MKEIFRRLKLIKVDHNLLEFLVFLCVSIGFWCLQTLKEDTTITRTYKINISNIPANVIFTSRVPSDLQVVIQGRGWDLIDYITQSPSDELTFEYEDIATKQGVATIDLPAIRKAVQRTLINSVQFYSASKSQIEIFYSTGKRKRVPVIFDGKVTTAPNYLLCGTILSPDSVDVYVSDAVKEKVTSVLTEHIELQSVGDTIQKRIALAPVTGTKIIPDTIDVTFCVDIFMEKELEVDIYSENTPSNMALRTFPQKAKVKFLSSASQSKYINKEDFLIVVDYNTIDKSNTYCDLQLKQMPENISNPHIHPERVEYVIEQTNP